MKEKIKILFVLPSLKAGGAERVVSFIAQNLDDSKFQAQLLVIGFEKDAAYSIKNINVLFLNKKRVLTSIPKLFTQILKKKPHIVFGSIAHVNRVLAMFSIILPKIKFVGREASVMSVLNKYEPPQHILLRQFFKNYHKYLDVVICQSNDMLNDIKLNNNLNESNLVVINNPITNDFQFKNKNVTNKNNIIKYITVGTLDKRKGHLRLLNILNKVNHSFHYTIIGSGDELESINQSIKKLNLSDKVTHIPYTNKVSDYLKGNDLFLNGSFVEGFPNVLLESCAVGTPVIAFDAPGGINEIILEGVNGHIVSSENEYVEKLNWINGNYNFDPKAINDSVTSRYSKEFILSKYEDLFINLTIN